MRRRLLLLIVLLIVLVGAGAFIFLTGPQRLAAEDLPAHEADLANGETLFWAAGCASCHATPDQDDPLALGGGLALETPFGTFHAPNISPHEAQGIGAWSEIDFVNAVTRGVAPDGRHYYPAFPYTSYRLMPTTDVLDLFAFIKTLPAVDAQDSGHAIRFPYNIRRGLGLWKRAYLRDETFMPDPVRGAVLNRGFYLVEGPGHCGECHTPRDRLGGLREEEKFTGGPSPEGDGRVPNITPHADGIEDWSEADIVALFETGFTPDFDTVGGPMAAVQRSLSHLGSDDLAAIAAYLKSVPPMPDAGDGASED